MSNRNRILFDTFRHLERLKIERKVTSVRLTRYFTVVEVDDGGVGACMSHWCQLDNQTLGEVEDRLAAYCRSDPFQARNDIALSEMLFDCVANDVQRSLVSTSFMAAVLSALSASIIRGGGDMDFKVTQTSPQGWLEGAESALVVGWGGFLDKIVNAPSITTLQIIDFLYDPRNPKYGGSLSTYQDKYPNKNIRASTHLDNIADLKGFDCVHITGSALCNGTLEGLLSNARKDAVVVLQGQSASVHPKILFAEGVKWIATTLKPKILTTLATQNRDGATMRPLLDGGLPNCYLVPTGRRDQDCSSARRWV